MTFTVDSSMARAPATRLAQAGGRWGILGSIGLRAGALMLVASRAVRPPLRPSRPSSRPSFRTISSPLGVPGVCEGNWALESNLAMWDFLCFLGWDHSTGSITSVRPSTVTGALSVTPSTSTAVASGALATIASSIVCFIVTADEGQPWQLPRSRSRTTPSLTLEQLDVAPVGTEGRPHLLQGLEHARLQVQGMQAVEQEQARRHLVARAGVEDRGAGLAGRGKVLEDPLQAGPVHVEDGLDDLPGVRLRRGVGETLHLPQQDVEPLQPCLELARVEGVRHHRLLDAAALRRRRGLYFDTPNIGVCFTSSSRPLPRYMWTPHGRHGSKLRTVRMMSMPLNLSGPFSSKMGVFCTASS